MILSLLIIPLQSNAQSTLRLSNGLASVCTGYNQNDSGLGWNYDTNTDCIQTQNETLISLNEDNTQINYFEQSFIYSIDIFDEAFNAIGGMSVYDTSFNQTQSNLALSDGTYYASIGTGITNVYYTFYVNNGKFYFDKNDIPNNDMILNQLLPQFIIVGLLVILIMFSIFNFKNPWKY